MKLCRSWREVLEQADGRGLWVPISRWDGTDSEEILLRRETESIRTGGENQEGKPRTSEKYRSRVI